MDDSIDAFQSCNTFSKKSKSLAIKRKNVKVSKDFKVHIAKSSTSNVDDTLYGIEDLVNDKKEIDQENVNKSVSPSTGFCSICNKFISKSECPTHHASCLKKTFSSKYSMKLSNVVVCPTCGKDIEVILYPSHVEACKKSNFEAAQRLSNQPQVTSSYFMNQRSPVKSVLYCPSCNKNLASLNNSQRTRHVNMCLDNSQRKSSSTESSENFTCTLCKKTLKSSRGLKLHARVCKENSNDLPKKKKRKIRVPKDPDEELVQLAKGLSASDHLAEKMFIKEEKKKKREIPVPALLQITESCRKANLQARLETLVCDVRYSESEVTSTPPLPSGNRWESSSHLVEEAKSLLQSDQIQSVPSQSSASDNHKHPPSKSKPFECQKITTNMISSKWELGTKPCNTEYRVPGLLSQFEYPNRNEIEKNESTVAKSRELNEELETMDCTLNCLMNLHKEDDSGSEQTDDAKFEPVDSCFMPRGSLSSDMASLFNLPNYSDMKLIFTDGFLHAHKCVLYSRCPRLLETLEEKFDDGINIHIDSCEIKDFKTFLSYVYSGSCENYQEIVNLCKKLEINLMRSGQVSQIMTPSIYATYPCPSENPLNNSESSPIKSPVTTLSDPSYSPVATEPSHSESQPPDSPLNFKLSPSPLPSVHSNCSPPPLQLYVSDQSEPDIMDTKPSPDNSTVYVMSDDDLFSSFTEKPRITTSMTQPDMRLAIGQPFDQDHQSDVSSGHLSDDSDLIVFNPNRSIDRSDKLFTPVRSSTSSGVKHTMKKLSSSQPIMRDSDVSTNDSLLLRAALHFDKEENWKESSINKTPTELPNSKLARHVVPITPMPNFSDMDTPEIIARGKRIGLKKSLGKKKVKVKLKEVHAYTHQIESSSDDELAAMKAPSSSSGPKITSSVPVISSGSDDDVVLVAPPNNDEKTEEMRSTKLLNDLPDEEFKLIFEKSLHFLHEKGILLKALQREDNARKKIPLGSRQELELWMHKVTPNNRHFRKEWPILIGLSDAKFEILARIFTLFKIHVCPGFSYHSHDLFNILPVIYRMAIKLNKKLAPLTSSCNATDQVDVISDGDDGSDVEALHATLFAVQEPADDKQAVRKKPANDTELDRLMFDLITSDKNLYNDVLGYCPVYLSRFKDLLKSAPFSCPLNSLLDYLDRQGITFSTADQRRNQPKVRWKTRKR